MRPFILIAIVLVALLAGCEKCSAQLGDLQANPYSYDSLSNPYGAGSPYKPDGLMNQYSRYGSPYSNDSWRNPYATNTPKIYSSRGYHGRLSTNRYLPDSTSNPYSRFGSQYGPQSIRNQYGEGSSYLNRPLYVFPSRN